MLAQMVEGLASIDGVTLNGGARERTSTVMFSVAGRSSHDVAAALARAEVAIWHGNYYALELSRCAPAAWPTTMARTSTGCSRPSPHSDRPPRATSGP